MSPAAHEALAVALYESDCRQQAGDMARRTVLSRVRAFYAFPSWLNAEPRVRQRWRLEARRMTAEAEQQAQDDDAWDAVFEDVDRRFPKITARLSE